MMSIQVDKPQQNTKELILAGYAISTGQIAKLSKELLALKLRFCGCSSWRDIMSAISTNFHSLTHLRVDRCMFNDESLEPLKDMNHIKQLYLEHNSISLEGVKTIAKFEWLQELSLSNDTYAMKGNTIKDEGVQILTQSKMKLKALCLNKCEITDKGAFMIAKFMNGIKNLEIKQNKITSEGLGVLLRQITSLERLNIMRNNIKSSTVSAFKEAQCSLLDLQISNSCFCDESVHILTYKMPKIQILSFGNSKVTNEGIKSISKNLTSIEKLSLWYAAVQGKSTIRQLIFKLPKLKNLYIGYNLSIFANQTIFKYRKVVIK